MVWDLNLRLLNKKQACYHWTLLFCCLNLTMRRNLSILLLGMNPNHSVDSQSCMSENTCHDLRCARKNEWCAILSELSSHFRVPTKSKKKSSPTTCHTGAWGTGDIAPTHSWLATRWGWVVSVMSLPHFTPGERTLGTHWIGGWVGPRAGLDTEAREKNPLPLPTAWSSRP
jgi:hypothetical protein